MKRVLLALALLGPGALVGQTTTSPFTFYVHDTTGASPDTPLPANYQLASTAVGNSTPTVLKMVNTSANTVNFVLALVSTSATSSSPNPNFSVTGLFEDEILPPGGAVLYTLNFTPTATGVLTGYLNVSFQVQQNGCPWTGTNACAGGFVNVSTLTGTATAPQLILSYQSATGPVVLTPASSSPLNFPNTSLSATSSYTFTLNNPTSVDTAAPAISLPTVNQNAPSAFELNTSTMPAVIAAGQSASFTVTFAPSQTGLASGELQVGSNTYPIQGAGIVVASIDSLQISYTDATGVRTLPQSATPISFGEVTAGSGGSAVLTFNVLNPNTSYNAVTIPALTISGAAFSLTGAPATPVSIAPGNAITFQAIFAPPASGSFTGSLAIGNRTFTLGGVSVVSAIPGFSITTNGPLSSRQQATLTVQLSAPSPVPAAGTISLEFTPAVAGVTDDPAVVFLATGGRQLSITLNSGATTALYSAQSAIAFQTGSTAGTITFSVAFANTAVYHQSFSIPATPVEVTSAQALRESPNLLVTVTGYDNTYSANQLSFTFYDTSGKAIGSTIPFNAAGAFQTLFFDSNTDGGVFTLQASFPVTQGDITQVGSVTVGIANAQGQTTTSATFQ